MAFFSLTSPGQKPNGAHLGKKHQIRPMPHCSIIIAKRSWNMTVAALKSVQINPVHAGYFADPFVWKVGDIYYAIGTGKAEAEGRIAGKVFPILRSTDFVEWQFGTSALVRPDHSLGNNFWAPAVVELDGTFYLYYSVGHGDQNHQLRVAASEAPQGPYEDLGKPLLDPAGCPFAIDPHPFKDDDGKWYLFYATDFLDCSHGNRAGTALMVSPMKTMTELDAQAITVLRARSDWQRFQQSRVMYGQIWDWHTLEGPCVKKHDDHYYCFYSGGRWETDNYGVDYGIAQRVTGPYSDQGSESGPRVLRTIPGHVLGPGHNSVITGPDNETDYIVYHAWDKGMNARRMFIDRLIWTREGPRCDGPTFSER